MEADAWREERQERLAVMTAWHTANFSRAGKKMPNLETALRRIRRKRRRGKRQTAEEQIAIMKMFSAGIDAKRR